MSLYLAMETGKRSIMTQQVALDTVGHNIANASTEGYTRQQVAMATTTPYSTPSFNSSTGTGQVGTGVTAESINRIRESFYDEQYRKENQSLGYWNTIQDSMSKIESIINEPSDYGLESVMESFWESWEDLALQPESTAARSVVVERANELADTFHQMYEQLMDLREDVNSNIAIKVDSINSIALEIADLNQVILAVNIAGQQANDLMDKRDMLLDELSRITKISYNESADGMINIQLGGSSLVQGVNCNLLAVENDEQGMSSVIWTDTGAEVSISGGELGALLELKEDIIPDLVEEINILAKNIAVTINEVHRSGYSLNNSSSDSAYPDGINFFAMPDDPDSITDWAEYIQVCDLISEDSNNIAAAVNRTWDEDGNEANFGDGSIAQQIAQLSQNISESRLRCRSDDLNGILAFPDSISGDLIISYDGGSSTAISLAAPVEEYQDLQDLAAAIQEQLDANTDLQNAGLSIAVSCDGDQLVFSSSSALFEGVSDGGLMGGGTAFSAIESSGGIIGNTTDADYWSSIVAGVGVQSDASIRMADNQSSLITQLENNRQSISGVSLDEEAANLVIYQAAYNAASRFITVIDEALNTVINSMGIVGR